MCIVFRKWGGLIKITSLQKKAKRPEQGETCTSIVTGSAGDVKVWV